MNYQAGDVSPNVVVAKVGAGGAICIFTLAQSDLIVDVTACVPSAGAPDPDQPSLSGISTDYVASRYRTTPRITLTGSQLAEVDLLLFTGPEPIGVRPAKYFDVTETSLTFELNHNWEPGTYLVRAAVWDEQNQAHRPVGGTVALTIEIEPIPAHNRFLAIYAVPAGQPVDATRPDLISDTIEAVQAWFDDDTGGMHPRVYESGDGVEVLTVEVNGALGAGDKLSDFTFALRDRLPATTGMLRC